MTPTQHLVNQTRQAKLLPLFPSRVEPQIKAVPAYVAERGKDEILSLEWPDIDLSRKQAWVTAYKAKSSYARSVPLSDEAIAVIKRRKDTHPRYAFTRNGKTQTVIDPKMVS